MNTFDRIVSLREALAIAFRDKWIIVGAFLVPVLIACAAALLTPRVYESTAVILVKTGRQFVPQSDVGQAINSVPVASMQETMNSEVSILNSRDLAIGVIQRVGLATLYPKIADGDDTDAAKLDMAVEAFDKDLKVDNPAQSTVINVALDNHDVAASTKALETLVALYRQKHVDVFATPRTQVLTEQLDKELASLAALEARTANFRIEHNVFDPDTQRQQLIEQRGTLVAARGDLESKKVELTNKLAFLNDKLSSTPETKTVGTERFSTDTVNNASTKLLELRREEQNLLSRYLENSRPVQNVRADIAVVEKYLAEQGKQFQGKVMTGVNPVYDDLRRQTVEAQADLEPIAKQSDELTRQIGVIDAQLQTLENDQRELAGLVRSVESGRDNVKVLREQLHQATINETLDKEKIDSISIVQEAAPLPDPVRPRRMLWGLAGIAIGILSAFGALVGLIVMRNTFLTADAIERGLKLPVLVSLPHLARAEPR
jgi:uncharacterized protein involved in exopolysaccharide biosynthesis